MTRGADTAYTARKAAPGRKVDTVPESELVPEDDAVIGRALRWSVSAVLTLAIAAGIGVMVAGGGDKQAATLEKDLGVVADRNDPAGRVPEVRFTDVTEQAGIDFRHVNGAEGDKLLPETMGGGAAFFDFDRDGDQDLLLVSGARWPEHRGAQSSSALALYANDGKGFFREITTEANLFVDAYGFGVAVGDYDNDGDGDLFLAALGTNRLFENEAGRFREVTAEAGVGGGEEAWSTSAGFFDYDNDGDLDLFVCNYVNWSEEIDLELNFTLNGKDRAYGPPFNYEGTQPYLYRNEGGGRFVDVSAEAGVEVTNPATGKAMAKSLALSIVDVDGDGFLDVLIANDTVQNFMFRNKGDGRFEEIGAVAGFGFDGAGNATGAMGIDAAHHRNDDELAVGIGNFANEMSSLYVAQRKGFQFTDEAIGEGVGAPSRRFVTFGLFFFDYDLDGRLDLLQANGHLEEEISQVQASQQYRQPAQLFWNAGPDAPSTFVEVPGESLGDLATPVVGRGMSYADIDADGDLDVLITVPGGRPLLLRNDLANGHHWLRLKLHGTTSNRDAIGAWVEVEAGGLVQRRQVMPTRSYLSQVELPVTVGLGDSRSVQRLRIDWPDGTRQEVAGAAVDALVEITQGE